MYISHRKARKALTWLTFLDPLENHWIYFFLALLTLAFLALAKWLGGEPAELAIGLIAGVLVALGAVLSFLKRRTPIAASDEIEISLKAPPDILIPSLPHDLEQGISLVHKYFNPRGLGGLANRVLRQRTPLILSNVMKEASEINPYSSFSFKDYAGNVCGFMELWSIKQHKLECLLDQTIEESDLMIEDFNRYSPTLSAFYVAVTFPDFKDDNRAGSPYARDKILFNASLSAMVLLQDKYLNLTTNPPSGAVRTLHLYGIDETMAGRRLMEKLGFVLDERRTQRRNDGRSIFHLPLTQNYLQQKRKQYQVAKRDIRVTIS